MKSEFGEFQFAVSIIGELKNGKRFSRAKGQSFYAPTPYEELKEGYDAKIKSAVPIYLQFKRSDYFFRSNATFYKKGFPLPYYQFDLYTYVNSTSSMRKKTGYFVSQHNTLIALAGQGNAVYYCAPKFHTTMEFDNFYISGQICKNSIFINVKKLTTYPSTSFHTMVFTQSGRFKPFSEGNIDYDEPSSFDDFMDDIGKAKSKSKDEIIENINSLFQANFSKEMSWASIQGFLNGKGIFMLLAVTYNEKARLF